jgi:hypothetical protein
MSKPARRPTRMAVIGFMLTLLVTARRAEHHPGPDADGGSNGLVSTLTVVPEILSELAQLLGAH